nr:immunoglobulin heavy chain junction region [Macaca mulatta]MOW98844.1 immunoglobulin heavy chain junction region [Macaca mulatta]MOW98930.1 immunoglobulin heavy chain junction region [Macaca mulatta]MOW98955.1 immunoglobulin heavy chain junction region [Macaca mulatta]MOW99828.1 immunoglobulin heavy chain junction region [Macaca mulatta]
CAKFYGKNMYNHFDVW